MTNQQIKDSLLAWKGGGVAIAGHSGVSARTASRWQRIAKEVGVQVTVRPARGSGFCDVETNVNAEAR